MPSVRTPSRPRTNTAPPETRSRGLLLRTGNIKFPHNFPQFSVLWFRVRPPHLFRCASGTPHETRGNAKCRPRKSQDAASNFHPLRTGNAFAGVPLLTPSGVRPLIEEDRMKRLMAVFAVLACALVAVPAVYAQAQARQVIPGTEVRLSLVNGLSSRVARMGDPFTAVVTEPVFSGSNLVLPAGAIVHGRVTSVQHPRWFSAFRGGAAMNLVFDSVEVDSRIFPARMSIITIYSSGSDVSRRKDLTTIEGEVVQEHQSIKGDVMDAAMGTAGGATLGLVFSRVMRGTILGLAGSGAYIAARKGKDVELPAKTGMIVRMDSTLSLPEMLLRNTSYATGQ